MMAVSNTTAAAVTADVFLDFQGKRSASAPLTFEAHETKRLSIAGLLADLGKLRDAQQADWQGHKIPATATDGIVLWSRLAQLPVMGQMEVVQPAEATASPDDEGGDPCLCYAGSLMVPEEVTLLPTQTHTFQVKAEYDDCNDDLSYGNVVTNWTSYNTAVAMVSPTQGVLTSVKAVGWGSADIMGDFTVQDCDPCGPCDCSDYEDQAFGTVDVNGAPNHVSVVVDQEGYPSACPATGIYLRQMQMQVVDVNNNSIAINANIQESFTNLTTNTCGNGQPVPSSCALTGNVGGVGQYLDTMSVSGNLCGSGINRSSGCGFSLTSTWSACSPSGNNTLWTSPRVTLSNGVEVNDSWGIFLPGVQFH
jgi:hypothetical protein